jgi:hypothetical protein
MTPESRDALVELPRVQPEPKEHNRSATCYRGSFELGRFPLDNGQELVYSPLTRAARVLPSFCVHLLKGCTGFATLKQHAERLSTELNLEQRQIPEIRQQLEELAEAGFLLTAADLLPSSRPAAERQVRIATLGVPTRNRTRSLQRCLSSYVESDQRHGRVTDYVVVDDSESAEIRRDNRHLLQVLGDQYRVSLAYAGPEERARFAEAITRQAGLCPEDVRFGLLGAEGYPITTGASRNALLLHAVGDAFLQVDDDTVAYLAPCPEPLAGLAFTSAHDPTEFWFPANQELLPFNDESVHLPVVHEQLLGKSLGGLAHDAASDLGGIESRFCRGLRSSSSRVLVTSTGVMGDSGMGSPSYFLWSVGPTRDRLVCSESVYRQALARHPVLRAVRRPTVSDGGFCMALNLGLDNRELLPPFMPVQRNQDGVFATLLRSCFADSFFGYLPWLLLHLPPTSRRGSGEYAWRSVDQVTSDQILQALVASFSPGPNGADPRRSLHALGQSLQDWGSAEPNDFEELVRLILWQQASQRVCQLESLLRETQGQPDFWAEDVQRVLVIWRESLADRRYVIPKDLVANFGHEAFCRLQQLVLRFGRLLQIWTEMVAAARELRTRCRRLASEV